MIDRKNRNKLAESCRHYWSCLIDNFEFDEINFTITTNDKGVSEIKYQLWYLYDDIRTHKNQGKWKMEESDEKVLKRTILFLKSDYEYKWSEPSLIENIKKYLSQLLRIKNETIDKTQSGQREYWPFFSKDEYENALSSPKYLNNNV
ncbi:hypothetical protein [Aquimarina rubra]|uniref:Uncharacterized protein n=1 Tax=Aquimarina rubra TaxID=1920033 RepID=A0ABW5LCI6_9FLAO